MKSDPPQILRRIWFVGFAGHRAVADRGAAQAAIFRELEIIRATISGELVGIASAAAGADLLFLDACAEAGLRTVVLLPFPKDQFSEDFDDPAEWEHACRCMDAAWWCEVSPGGEPSPAAYHVTARETLEVADRMIFLWNGEPAKGLGGTAETVQEARERSVPSRVIDAHSLEASWQTAAPATALAEPTFENLPPSLDIEDLFRKLDARAAKSAPRSRWFSAGSMSLNHLATLLQAVLIIFALAAAEAGAMLKLCLVSLAALLPWIGGRLRLQEHWIQDRVRAELLRSLLHSHELGSPLRPPALELFGQHEAFVRTVALNLIHKREGWESARNVYQSERVDGQIGYLKSKGNLAKKRMAIFGKLFWVASSCAVILSSYAVITAYLKINLSPNNAAWLGFVTAVLPGIAAWSLAMISVFEFKRRAAIYHQLVGELQRLRPKLAAAKCASAVAHAVSQIERLLLNELWEWHGSRKK